MKIIEEKKRINRNGVQSKGIELSKSNSNMILSYPTGLGKSYTMIMILDYIFSLNPYFKCLLLEPEIALIENIKKEFIKFEKENLLKNIEIICYHSLKKVEVNYDILVLDEAHHAFSEKRINLLKNQNPKNILLLSATLTPYQIKFCEKIFNCDFCCHKISLHNAIVFGILPAPKVGLFKLILNENLINCQYSFERGDKEKRRKVEVPNEKSKWKYIKDKINYPDLELIINCTEKQKYDQLVWYANSKKEKYLEDTSNEKNEKSWLYAELCIKRFLAEIKTQYLKEFLKDAINSRFIAFVGSVSQANELKKEIKELNVISSEEKDSQNIINSFIEGEINNLVTCKMIQEGANLPLELCIISQLDGKIGNFLQRVGRGLRSERPEIYIFYFENTKDEEYLKKALKVFEQDMLVELDYFYK